jgi:hypothetical protein
MSDSTSERNQAVSQVTCKGTFAPLFRGQLSYEEHVRLEIVKLLAERHGGDATRLVEASRVVADFVLGRSDSEILAAAREFAGKVR